MPDALHLTALVVLPTAVALLFASTVWSHVDEYRQYERLRRLPPGMAFNSATRSIMHRTNQFTMGDDQLARITKGHARTCPCPFCPEVARRKALRRPRWRRWLRAR